MFYREAGQFKTSYAADQALLPILQDRIGLAVVLAIAFILVPIFGTSFFLVSIMIPFLIYALAAVGLNHYLLPRCQHRGAHFIIRGVFSSHRDCVWVA